MPVRYHQSSSYQPSKEISNVFIVADSKEDFEALELGGSVCALAGITDATSLALVKMAG